MIAYHVDRLNSLSVGQTIELLNRTYEDSAYSFAASMLFNSQLTSHGNAYIHDSNSPGGADTICSIIEYETELVRQLYFPHMFSRFQSFFAVETLDDLFSWNSCLISPEYKVYQVKFDDCNYQKLDASLLPNGLIDVENFIFSPSLNFQRAYNYWSQQSSDAPQYELLIKPPVFIEKEIHLSIVPK